MTPAQKLRLVEAPLAAPVRDGGHPHRGGVDDRRGDAVDHGRPAEPRRPDLRRAADPELGAGARRLRRRRGAGAGGRRAARRWSSAASRRAGAGCGSARPAALARGAARGDRAAVARSAAADRRGRRQEFLRAVHPGPADRRAAGACRLRGRVSRRARLGGGLRRARGRAMSTSMSIMPGTLWTNADGAHRRAAARARWSRAIARWARRRSGVRVVGPLGFENAYAFAMRAADAQATGHRDARRSRRAPRRSCGWAAIWNSSTGPNGARCATPIGLAVREHARPTARPSCTARWRAARRT